MTQKKKKWSGWAKSHFGKVASVSFDFGSGGVGVFWSTAPEEAAGDVTRSSTCPRLCRYLSKYSLSLLEISIYKCLSGALCVQFKYCSQVNIDGGHRSMAAKILQTGGIPEEWTPPSVSVAPLLLLLHPPLATFLPVLSSRAVGGKGWDRRRRRARRHTLAATHCRKQETDVSHTTSDQ